MNRSACPDPAQLLKLLAGESDSDSVREIEAHLLECEPCALSAETLFPENEVTAFRQAMPIRFEDSGDERILEALIHRGKSMHSDSATALPEQTQIGVSRDDDNVSEDSKPSRSESDSTDDLSYLAPAQQPDEIGRLGDYRILQVLGRGGMGVVFRAEDPRLKRQVALKVMKPSIAASRSAKDRFLREAQFTASIEHDHIVHIYQVGEDRGVPFIAMPFLKGESLKTKLEREGRLQQSEVVRIGKEVAAGLAAAHDRGLIHRDIKPDNIWIEEKTGRAKILDFGLVRSVSDDTELTQSGMVLGTPKYMAPEQAQGQNVDHRCDLFSLGSVLYHLATGKPAFEGNNLTATLMAVVHHEPKSIEVVSPDIHPQLASLIAELVKKDRDQRPQSASLVSQRLADIEQTLKNPSAGTAGSLETLSNGSRTPIESIVSTNIAEVTIIPQPVVRRTPPRPPRSNKLMLAAGAGGLLLMLGILIITIRDKDGKETTVRVPSGVVADIDVQPGSKVSIREESESETAAARERHSAVGSKSVAGIRSIPRSQAESERELAAWLLARRGIDLQLDALNGTTIHVSTEGTLPTADFLVSSIAWSNAAEITDEDLAHIGQCQELAVLTLGVPQSLKITDKGLDALLSPSVSRTLKQLTLGASPGVTKDGYLTINRATELLLLSLRNFRPPADGKLFEELRLPKLTDLMIWESDFSGGWLAAFVKRSPDVAHLVLQGVRVTPADIAALTHLDPENLGLENAGLSDAELNVIGSMRKLRILSVRENPAITDAGVRSLAQCKELQTLWLSSASLTDAACDAIATLPALESVVLDNTPITDAGLDRLTANTKLNFLGLQGCKRLTAEGLESVAKLKALKVLEIRNNPQLNSVTKAGLEAFQSRIPWCKVISDFGVLEPRQDMTSVLRESSSLVPVKPSVWPVGPLPAWASEEPRLTTMKESSTIPGAVERPTEFKEIGRWNVDTVHSRGLILVARYSPDSKWLATGGNDGHVRIYEAASMKLHRLLPGFVGGGAGAGDLSWHPDSQKIAVAADRQLRIWKVDGQLVHEEFPDDSLGGILMAVAWTFDGSRLICAGTNRLDVRDTSGTVIKSLTEGQPILNNQSGILAVSPNSQRFVCWNDDKARIWNAETYELEQTIDFPSSGSHRIRWSSKDRISLSLRDRLVICGADGSVLKEFPSEPLCAAAWRPDGENLTIWRLDLNNLNTQSGDSTPADQRMFFSGLVGTIPTAIDWSPDGKHLVVAGGRLAVCNETLSEIEFDTQGTLLNASCISMNPDGSQIASASQYSDNCVRIWSSDGTAQSSMSLTETVLYSPRVAWSPDGRHVAVGWPVASHFRIEELGGSFVTVAGNCVSLAWNPEGTQLAAGLTNGHILITGTNGKTLHDLDTEQMGAVNVAWSKFGTLVAHAGQKLLRINPDSKDSKITLLTEAPDVGVPAGYVPVWRPDGKEVCISLDIHLNVADGAPERIRRATTALAWAPDGSKYLNSYSGFASLHRIDGNTMLGRITNASSSTSFTGAWSPDGKTVFIGQDQSLLVARNADDLHVKWSAVLLPNQKSVTFDVGGSVLDADRETLDGQFAYYTADEAGNVSVLSPTEFELRTGEEILPVPGRYFDSEYRFAISTGDDWKPAPLESVTVPGIARAAFSKAGGVSLSLFIQETGDLVDASWMLAESAKAQEEKLSATVLEKEVRKIAGRDAMWMIVEGQGNGSAIDGKGPVKTTQHWIAIPREKDVVVALLTSPSGTFAGNQKPFLKAVETLMLKK